ncbi:MAG: hypothetical protein IT373_03280 [Polyangiaceae bacterium]|nr:hypothetical protein [Polyangiaceae bacterium]
MRPRRSLLLALFAVTGCQAISGASDLRTGTPTGTTTTSGTGGVGGQGLELAEYGATIAECVYPSQPDPAQCEQSVGFGRMVIDTGTPIGPVNAYVAFRTDAAFAGGSVVGVELRLVAASEPEADGPASGEVFEVEPFTVPSLDLQVPQPLGLRLAPDQGAVHPGDTAAWALPAGLVGPDTDVFLGIFPGSNDGVRYWNGDGAVPPRLVVYWH